MFRHLLVPLDGSSLAESALPAAAEMARRTGARVTLFHAVESGAPSTIHGDRHLSDPAEAERYLAGAGDWLAARQVRAAIEVRQAAGDVAYGIAAQATGCGADLVVLCTHGRSGIKGILFGRVAQQVLQRGRVPVLLVPPSPAGRGQPFSIRKILVPLDGSETAETAIRPASEVAGPFGAEIILMWVVPTVETLSGERGAVSRWMPTAATALLDTQAAQAEVYLHRIAAQLREAGRAASAMVERGDPVRALLDATARRAIDLIVMATHGRSGISAVWAGSVASRVIANSARPMLLIRIPQRD